MRIILIYCKIQIHILPQLLKLKFGGCTVIIPCYRLWNLVSLHFVLLEQEMASHLLAAFLLFDQILVSLAQGGPEPLQIPRSNRVYGPDGPWQAVSVQIGSPAQRLDLYPGGIYQSTIFTRQICQDISQFPCGSGGLFDPENSATLDDDSISFGSGLAGIDSLWTDSAILFSYSNSTSILEQLQIAGMTVANFSAIMFSNITMVYPNGKYPLQVGELALGPVYNQSFSEGLGNPSINASLIPGDLDLQKAIPSNSFGLHVGIGVKALELNLSLWLGGYDASRIIGPVSSQSTNNFQFAIDLLDIGIGVDHGGSPLLFLPQQGLLSQRNSSLPNAGLPVTLNPSAPYLSLPNSTCAAIANNLPVTYDAGMALYFWDTADHRYAKIVTSPTYLSFVFRGSSGNLTIKVPFQLLNLTLEEPLVSVSTAYFPCQPPQGSEGHYSLGRAFLQAAFIGVNWARAGQSDWYLAQAPGPNTNTNPQSRSFTSSPPVGTTEEWADTWDGFWTALPSATVTSNTLSETATAARGPSRSSAISTLMSSPPSPHSLSGGAIAGIAIGGAFALLLVACGVGVWLYRHRRGGDPAKMQAAGVDKAGTHISLHQLLPQHQGTGSDMVLGRTGDSHKEDDPTQELPVDRHRKAELPGQ